MTEFDNLRTLHAATTPGEWQVDTIHDGRERSAMIPDVVQWRGFTNSLDFGEDFETARFIAAAHNELPALLARLDEVTAEKDALAVANETARNLLVASFQTAWGDNAPLGKKLSHEAVEALSTVAIASVLAAHDAKVRAEALRDAADAFDGTFSSVPEGAVEFTQKTPGRYGDYRDEMNGHMLQSHNRLTVQRYLCARADKEENR